MALPKPQVFRRAGKMELRKLLFQFRAGAHRQLRGNQDQRAGRRPAGRAALNPQDDFVLEDAQHPENGLEVSAIAGRALERPWD